MILEAQNITFSYGLKQVIDSVGISLTPGKLTVVIGPNGSGKSTFLNLLGGFLKPDRGSSTLDGREIKNISASERAMKIGVLSQSLPPPLDFSVYERIMTGRFARLPRLLPPSADDEKFVGCAMDEMGISAMADIPCNQLSGGTYQKVLIAALLARECGVMLLDEPVSSLDPASALRVMKLLQQKKKDAAVMVVVHDLILAGAFADELLLFKEGRVFCSGTPEQVLTKENISEVYGCEADVIPAVSGPVTVFRCN
ncbi:MAG: ABC transporter ATP-binding protein [Lentisphaeria bacterium]|nr:ABC transporter ATP-binding protein [Lentisphaeria bacterium]